MQFQFSLGLYQGFLCVYFLLLVKYNIREETIAARLEPLVHAFAFLPPLVMAIIILNLEMYNPSHKNPGHCFINSYPANCDKDSDDANECTRGINITFWRFLSTGPLFVYWMVVIVSSILVFQTVRATEVSIPIRSFTGFSLPPEQQHSGPSVATITTKKRQQQEQQQHSESSATASTAKKRGRTIGLSLDRYRHEEHDASDPTPVTHRPSSPSNANRRMLADETTRQTFIQCTLFIVGFFVTYIFIAIVEFGALALDDTKENRTFYFVGVCLVKLSLPTPGIWNFGIYCRPRLVILRKNNPEASFRALMWQIVFHSSDDKQTKRVTATRKSEPAPILPPLAYLLIRDENCDGDFTPELFGDADGTYRTGNTPDGGYDGEEAPTSIERSQAPCEESSTALSYAVEDARHEEKTNES